MTIYWRTWSKFSVNVTFILPGFSSLFFPRWRNFYVLNTGNYYWYHSISKFLYIYILFLSFAFVSSYLWCRSPAILYRFAQPENIHNKKKAKTVFYRELLALFKNGALPHTRTHIHQLHIHDRKKIHFGSAIKYHHRYRVKGEVTCYCEGLLALIGISQHWDESNVLFRWKFFNSSHSFGVVRNVECNRRKCLQMCRIGTYTTL